MSPSNSLLQLYVSNQMAWYLLRTFFFFWHSKWLQKTLRNALSNLEQRKSPTLLRREYWKTLTDVSGKPSGPWGWDRCSLRNDPEERSSHLLRGGSLKSLTYIRLFGVRFRRHIPNSDAPVVSRILKIATINQLYVQFQIFSFASSIDNLNLAVIPYYAYLIS